MLSPKQIKIFEAFLRKPYRALTYREIKEYSREKSNSVIQNAIKRFIDEELVRKRLVGNIILYKLVLENAVVFSYFEILIKEKLSQPVRKTIKTVKEEFDVDFLSIVIFGSYVQGSQTQKSDIDIAVFVDSEKDKKSCELSIKTIELKSLIPVDIHIITRDEMLYMLRDKRENLGKQIARKHLAIHNPAIFYSIIQKGVNNGFQIIY
jgi:predicted nucleotidyltransferase